MGNRSCGTPVGFLVRFQGWASEPRTGTFCGCSQTYSPLQSSCRKVVQAQLNCCCCQLSSVSSIFIPPLHRTTPQELMPAEVVDHELVRAQLNVALNMMNTVVDGLPLPAYQAPPPMPYDPYAARAGRGRGPRLLPRRLFPPRRCATRFLQQRACSACVHGCCVVGRCICAGVTAWI